MLHPQHRSPVHKNMFTSIGIDPNTLYPRVLPRPAPLSYTPSCPAHRFMPPLNFARDEKRTVPGGTGTEEGGEEEGGEGEGVRVKEEFVSEEMEDLLDSLTPIYDQLRLVKGWWILEVLPYKHRYQKMDNTWTKSKGINLGFPRIIPKQERMGVKVHRTVKIRMEATGLFEDKSKALKKYVPAAKLDVEPSWVG